MVAVHAGLCVNRMYKHYDLCVWLRILYYIRNPLIGSCSYLHVQKDSRLCIQGQ